MKDALVICALFNIIDRMADALDVAIPSSVGFARTAERLLEETYSNDAGSPDLLMKNRCSEEK